MRRGNTVRWSVRIAMALVLSATPALAQMRHDHADMDEHGESHDAPQEVTKARCAYDAMLMKTSAMVESEIDGLPTYFCTEQQADAYAKDPTRYRSQIKLGHLRINVNVLTASEHAEVMRAMGMGSMEEKSDRSHHTAVYITQHGQDIQLEDVKLALRVTDADGATRVVPMKFNKMMKTFDAAIDLRDGEEHELGVLMTTPSVTVAL